MAEHTISERKLLEKEVDIESRLKKYQIKEKIKQYEKANKVSNAYKSVKRAFSVQSAIYDVLSKELGGEKSSEFAMLFSLGVAAKEGLETIVEKDNYGKNFFDGTQDIKFDRIVPDPVVGLYKLYSSALEFCIKANKNIEEVTSDFYKWIMKKVDEEKSKPHFAKFEAEIKKKPIVLEGKSGKKEYKACVAGTKRADEKKKTKYTWENIGGYDDTKKELMDYARFIETYERCKTYMEDPVPKGILFYGPPGTGKTLLARTMAEQAGVPFIYVRASDVGSSYVNESMIKINEKFKEAKTYIKNGVSDCVVLFIDEIDAIASKRSDSQNKEDNKVVNTLLTNLDGDSMDGIIFLAATNRYDILDDAITRPGRFDDVIEIGMPDEKAREFIYKVQMKKAEEHAVSRGAVKCYSRGIDYKRLAELSEGFSGAHIASVVKKTGQQKLRESYPNNEISAIMQSDLEKQIYLARQRPEFKNGKRA